MSEPKKIITRFAPSPTGFMHVGNLRTGLFAWLWARKNSGTFILRIEDTDKKREVEGSIEHIKESLRWVGMDWDEGPEVGGPHTPYIQSERLNLYKSYGEKLIEKGLAYADPYSEAQLEVLRKKAEEEKRPFLYREHRPENPPVWDGSMPLRFKVPEIKRYTWTDAVWGELSAGPEALDDLVLIKSDGYPTYNFAHLVDDIEMGVTHVMRGQEFISSTPKYLSIYEALGVAAPIFVTTPPVMSEEGKKKLGKRDGAKDVLEYRKDGYLPEAMMNFLALLGWNPGGEQEVFSKDELINLFDIKKIQRSGGQFGDEKLDWLNKEHLKRLPENEFITQLKDFVPERVSTLPHYNESRFFSLAPMLRERISKFSDIAEMAALGEFDFFFEEPTLDSSKLCYKKSTPEATLENLKRIYTILSETEPFSLTTTKEAIDAFSAQAGRGEVLHPMRYALSGAERSPDPFTIASTIGKNESLKRIQTAINLLSS